MMHLVENGKAVCGSDETPLTGVIITDHITLAQAQKVTCPECSGFIGFLFGRLREEE